ncbi:MAG: hypothetical protein ACJ75B_00945 [Flavisolibacter sp.]
MKNISDFRKMENFSKDYPGKQYATANYYHRTDSFYVFENFIGQKSLFVGREKNNAEC